MARSVRIQTRFYGDDEGRTRPGSPWHQYEALQRLLRSHLPERTASVFARPEPATDGSGAIHWTSELAGQPVAFLDLAQRDQIQVRRLLAEHLAAIARLADQLGQRETEDVRAAALLRASLIHPGEDAVYVIDGAPLLISWGGEGLGRTAAEVEGGGRAPPPGVSSPGRSHWLRWVAGFAGVAALMAAALGGWFWHVQNQEQGLRDALSAALALECDSETPLTALLSRLDRLDPERVRHPDLWMAALTEQSLCAEGRELSERWADHSDCEQLFRLSEALERYSDRAPFSAIKRLVEEPVSVCLQIEALGVRLDEVSGDCRVLPSVALEIESLLDARRTGSELADLDILARQLAQASHGCRFAEHLGARIADVSDDCPALRLLASESVRELTGADPHGPPVAAVIKRLDTALARCDHVDYLERRLAQSQEDCLLLAGLRETLARDLEGQQAVPRSGPLAALSERIDIALGQCADLNDLERGFAHSLHDCARLQDLAEGFGAYRTNLRFLEIGSRLSEELQVCAEVRTLEERISALGGDCVKTRELDEAMTDGVVDPGDPRVQKARASLKARVADCEASERYRSRLADAGTDCSRLKRLERELAEHSSPALGPLRQHLAERLEPCRRPPPSPPAVREKPRVAAAVTETSRTTTTRPDQPSGSFPMRGECSGRLTIEPPAGWDGDRVRHIVTIDPPVNARVARVTSTNPGCRDCALTRIGPGSWRGDFFYRCGGRGIVEVSYAAYDQSGKRICSGNGSDLCLGRKR